VPIDLPTVNIVYKWNPKCVVFQDWLLWFQSRSILKSVSLLHNSLLPIVFIVWICHLLSNHRWTVELFPLFGS
jgi:hypothetical protein